RDRRPLGHRLRAGRVQWPSRTRRPAPPQRCRRWRCESTKVSRSTTEYSYYRETDLDLKLLLKRGALLAAANWPAVVIQFAAETTFQALLAVPLVGAAILVAVLLGADLANVLQGTTREIITTIANALMSEPVALVAFVAAFSVVLLGGSAFMFLVKGGTMEV